MNYENLINKAIVGTSLNHPNWDMGKQMEFAFYNYVEAFGDKNVHPIKKFCAHISPKLDSNGMLLREPILKYVDSNNFDGALGFMDVLYKYSSKKIRQPGLSDSESIAFTSFLNKYLRVVSKYVFDDKRYKMLLSTSKSILNDIKGVIYKNPSILKEFVSNSIEDIRNNKSYLSEIIDIYCNDLEKMDIFNMDSIDIIEVSDTAKDVLTNVTDNTIVDSFSGKLLNGRITVASDRGYINKTEMPQQDAVWTGIKSDDCFLAVVADGAGGSKKGEVASMAVVQTITDWFENFPEEGLKSIDKSDLVLMIDRSLIRLNNQLVDQYGGESYSTIVFALCIGDSTIVGNVGDSTAYSYDKDTDELIEITTLDSLSKGLSYEKARHNPDNNVITSAIGDIRKGNNHLLGHYKLFYNEGEKIILSSDGVTDLASEERFKSYFRKNDNAVKIVNDAVYNPEVPMVVDRHTGEYGEGKSADNVSAIVIQLPNNYNKSKNSVRRS